MENDSKTTSADNWGQIIRKDARGCFVEIKNDCFHLEKVHLQFVSYDTSLPKGSRYTSNINIYIDVPEFLALTQEAASRHPCICGCSNISRKKAGAAI